jgi:hypothetical protein
MLAAGATAEVIAAAWKAELACQQKALEEKRAKDAERQRRHRMSRDVTVTNSESRGQDATPAPDKVSPQTPNQINPTPAPPYNPPSSPKRGNRLPDDFQAPEDWIAWAIAKRRWSRADAIDEAECFVRYWQAKPGREACKLDWTKTWQNWAVNSRRGTGKPQYDPDRITV